MSEVKKQYHVMLAFASLIPSMKETKYYGIDRRTLFTGVQSNEAGICQVQEMLRPNGLDRIILIVSETANQPAEIKSESDKQKWQQFLDSKNKDSMSPVDFLKTRISDKYPNLEDKFMDIPYSENDSTRDSMNRIAEVAELVQEVVDKVRETSENTEDAEIILHADMTGGFRYAAMMMLAIMQLSKYMGAKIGHVIYSELPPRERPNDPGRIRVADDIHRMFDLIAGADEFQKYGSVQALEEYFGDTEKYGAAFQELFHAMRRFSDAIRICRTSVIEHEMSELAEKIRHFRDNKGSAIEEEMFAKIIGVIEKEYGSVIINADEPEADRRLDIIAWCVRKKFLQQAMTLCSEWIPGILVEKKIFYPKDEATIINLCEKKKENWQSWQTYFIKSYNGNASSVSLKECKKSIVAFLKNSGAESYLETLPENLQEVMRAFWTAYRENYHACQEVNIRTHKIATHNPTLKRAISALKNTSEKIIFYKNLPTRITNISSKIFDEVFSIKEEIQDIKEPPQEIESNNAGTTKWIPRERQYRAMLAEKGALEICTKQTEDEAIAFLHGFFEIRQERNQTNHAAEVKGKTNEELETFIAAYIKKLRAVKEA